MDFEFIRIQARIWRSHQEAGCPLGYVVMFNGQVVGWKRGLDNPQGWEPGCLAISPSGNVYQAKGGNAYDGARVWQRLDLPNPASERPCQPAPEQLLQSIDNLQCLVNRIMTHLLESNQRLIDLSVRVDRLQP